MLHISFAYTHDMQYILTLVNFITCFIYYHFTTRIIMTIYGEKPAAARQLLFTFLTATVLNNLWTYTIYWIGDKANFSSLTYALVTAPNPIFALLYYYFGIKVLNLSPFRSIRLMSHAFLYICTTKVFAYFIGSAFFPQTGNPYNYLSDAVSLVTVCAGSVIICCTLLHLIKTSHFRLQYRDGILMPNIGKAVTLYIINSFVIYAIIVLPRVFMPDSLVWRDALQLSLLIVLLIVRLLEDMLVAANEQLSVQKSYLRTLITTVDEFSGLKHDINNILQTYSGYISMENMDGLKRHHEKVLGVYRRSSDAIDLNKKLEENPELISLLISKTEYAQSLQVRLRFSILCSLRNIPLPPLDFLRIIANLLDNAIEAASEAPPGQASFTIEKKNESSHLIVITNSTLEDINVKTILQRGFTSKANHDGLGLSQVQKLVEQNNNCALTHSYENNIFCVYLEITDLSASKKGKAT